MRSMPRPASGSVTDPGAPLTVSVTTCSSGLVAISEYVPGRSRTRAPTARQWPVATCTVVPGALMARWRAPVILLKSVDLPTLGLPTRAMVGSRPVIVATPPAGASDGWHLGQLMRGPPLRCCVRNGGPPPLAILRC